MPADRFINLVDAAKDIGRRIGNPADSIRVAQLLGHVRHVVVAGPKFLRQYDMA